MSYFPNITQHWVSNRTTFLLPFLSTPQTRRPVCRLTPRYLSSVLPVALIFFEAECSDDGPRVQKSTIYQIFSVSSTDHPLFANSHYGSEPSFCAGQVPRVSGLFSLFDGQLRCVLVVITPAEHFPSQKNLPNFSGFWQDLIAA